MRYAVAVLAVLALAAGSVCADDFDDDFASAPPTRGARGARGAGAGAGETGGARSKTDAGDASDDGAPSSGLATTKKAGRGVEEVTFVLEHSLVFGPSAAAFTACGVFAARAHYGERNGQEVVRLSHLKLQRDPIDEDFQAAFAELVAQDLHYRVRLPANVLHPREGDYVMVAPDNIACRLTSCRSQLK